MRRQGRIEVPRTHAPSLRAALTPSAPLVPPSLSAACTLNLALITHHQRAGAAQAESVTLSQGDPCGSSLLWFLLCPGLSSPPQDFFFSSPRLSFSYFPPATSPFPHPWPIIRPSLAVLFVRFVSAPKGHRSTAHNSSNSVWVAANLLLARSVFHSIPCSHPPWEILSASSNPLGHR